MNECDDAMILKIIIIGDSFVGKTSLLRRYIDGKFDTELTSTIGVDVIKKTIVVKDEYVCLTFCDTAGQEKFQAITDSYFKGACACIIVYDITRRVTFNSVDKWYNKLTSIVFDRIPILIIGNKSDIEQERDVNTYEGTSLAESYKAYFMETSCKNGNNVNEAIALLIQKVTDNLITPSFEDMKRSQRESVHLDKPVVSEEKKECC